MMAQLSKVLLMSLAFRGLSGVIQLVIAVTAAARTNQVFHAVLIGRSNVVAHDLILAFLLKSIPARLRNLIVFIYEPGFVERYHCPGVASKGRPAAQSPAAFPAVHYVFERRFLRACEYSAHF